MRSDPVRATPSTRAAGALLGTLLVLAALTGCAGGPPVSPARGIDGLTIPTPDPRPGDFVDVVDNPWLPYEPGARWTYVQQVDDAWLTTVVEVGAGPVVDGVATSSVTTRVEAGRPEQRHRSPVRRTVDYVAQDRAGDVWWFGREGDWQAGVDGARAGLLMAARPRLGDGYEQGPDVAEVSDVDVDGTGFEAANGEVFARTVELTVATDGDTLVQTYAEGVGLVQEVSVGQDAGLPRSETPRGLVSYDEPEPS